MRKLEVRIGDDQRQGLKELAKRSGLSRAYLVRRALAWLIEHPEIALAVLVSPDRRSEAA
jgi:predicted DNA-binding protein